MHYFFKLYIYFLKLSFLPSVHGSPVPEPIQIINQKNNKAQHHRQKRSIRQGRQYPQHNQYHIICRISNRIVGAAQHRERRRRKAGRYRDGTKQQIRCGTSPFATKISAVTPISDAANVHQSRSVPIRNTRINATTEPPHRHRSNNVRFFMDFIISFLLQAKSTHNASSKT